MGIKMKLYALGGAALVGVPVVRALGRKIQAYQREKVYQDVLTAALADGTRSVKDCIKAAKAAANRI
jgi:hypothetical protein